MPCELIKGPNGWCLALSGVVDLFDAADLHAAAIDALEHGPPRITIRLEAATSIDTSATQILLALRRALTERERNSRLEGTPAKVAAVWATAGLGALLA